MPGTQIPQGSTSGKQTSNRSTAVIVVLFCSMVLAAVSVAAQSSSYNVGIRQLAKLTPSDGIRDGGFGNFVSTNGNTVVVSEERDFVYVFVRPESGWADMTQTAELRASDGANLASAVGISGNTVVATGWQGSAVYVFVEPPTGWADMTETAKLSASDGGQFWSVAISGDTVVAGQQNWQASGTAYVFVRPSGGWTNMTETAKLTASDPQTANLLGFSVATNGDTVAAGAIDATVNSNLQQGAVYLFLKPAGGWVDMTETAKLTASNGLPHDGLGWAVGLSGSGTTVVAVAPYKKDGSGKPAPGEAYVFEEPPTGWISATENARLGQRMEPREEFFSSVAISNNGKLVAVGADDNGDGTLQGCEDLFIEPVAGWKSTSKATAVLTAGSDGKAGDQFGRASGIGLGFGVVTAPYVGSGVAYVFGAHK